MPDTYQAVREAAETLATNASADTWALADAVLAHVPMNGHGGGQRTDVGPLLDELAASLAADDVTNERGEPWAAATLGNMRDVAHAWPPAERLPGLAFYVHAEARGEERRLALGALVAYASGADDGTLLPETVRERIDARRARGARRLVTVDDLRLTTGRKPTRLMPETLTDEQVTAALAAKPELVAQAVAAEPAVAEAISGDLHASAAMLRADVRRGKARGTDVSARPTPKREALPPLLLFETPALLHQAKQLLAEISAYEGTWRPEALETVLRMLDETSQTVDSIRTLLTQPPLSDEALGTFLEGDTQ